MLPPKTLDNIGDGNQPGQVKLQRHYDPNGFKRRKSMVYVISKEGQPLMPTERHGKVKHLLRQGRAKVARSAPFTIQLQNVREYIFHRDGHKCQKPECKSKGEKVLCEHHIIPRAQGGTDAPDNLVTLCNQCHTSENHKGFLKDWKPKVNGFKAETFMTTVRHTICEQLKGIFPNVGITYGYITKHRRIGQKLAKTHANDGYIIAGGKGQPRAETLSIRQIRRNNRSLERFYDAKYIDTRTGKPEYASVLNNGRTTRNMNLNGENLKKYRGEKVGKGRRSIRRNHYFYQPNDLVKYEGKIYEVKGVVNRGNYVALKGIKKQPKVEQLKPYRFRKGFVIENRKGKRDQGGAIHPTA